MPLVGFLVTDRLASTRHWKWVQCVLNLRFALDMAMCIFSTHTHVAILSCIIYKVLDTFLT